MSVKTPLGVACEVGQLEVVQLLLKSPEIDYNLISVNILKFIFRTESFRIRNISCRKYEYTVYLIFMSLKISFCSFLLVCKFSNEFKNLLFTAWLNPPACKKLRRKEEFGSNNSFTFHSLFVYPFMSLINKWYCVEMWIGGNVWFLFHVWAMRLIYHVIFRKLRFLLYLLKSNNTSYFLLGCMLLKYYMFLEIN